MLGDETKFLAMAVVIIAALIGGMAAFRIALGERGQLRMTLGNAFAGGIFLGAALIHLLGDGTEALASIENTDVRWIAMLAGAGFLLVVLPEHVVLAGRAKRSHVETPAGGGGIYPFILALVLSLHSLIAGAALGLEQDASAFFGVLIAILAHKGSAAFSLVAALVKGSISRPAAIRILLLFSVMTPLGILLGTLFSSAASGRTAILTEAVFDGLAAGTFLYIASMEIFVRVFREAGSNLAKFALIGIGFGLMAVLSLYT